MGWNGMMGGEEVEKMERTDDETLRENGPSLGV